MWTDGNTKLFSWPDPFLTFSSVTFPKLSMWRQTFFRSVLSIKCWADYLSSTATETGRVRFPHTIFSNLPNILVLPCVQFFCALDTVLFLLVLFLVFRRLSIIVEHGWLLLHASVQGDLGDCLSCNKLLHSASIVFCCLRRCHLDDLCHGFRTLLIGIIAQLYLPALF